MLNPLSNATMYGKGVFTTLVFADSAPLYWEMHASRLAADAARIGLEIPDLALIQRELKDVVRRCGHPGGRARVTISDPNTARIWSAGSDMRPFVSIVTGKHRTLPQAFRLTISDFAVNSRSPLAGVKSCNYLENLMALDAARSDGFDEALRLNERGEIAGAACANVFWIKNGRLFTPGVATGCLAGTTRALILSEFEVEQVAHGIDAIRNADAVILTSAGIGAKRATFENGLLAANDVADNLIRRIAELYQLSDQNSIQSVGE